MLRIGLIGTGTVGGGVIQILEQKIAEYKEKLGVELELACICAKSDVEVAPYKEKGYKVSTNADEMIASNDIDVLVELAGGYNMPRKWILAALNSGKHVVTANKALLAKYGHEIFPLAAEKGLHVLFEAAVGGGIPIIRSLQEGLLGSTVESLSCIINGTCNYILSRMADEGLDFDVVLKDAQRLGFAEADPTFDIEGIDSAHKTALLASLCSGKRVDFEKIHVTGISKITAQDIAIAKELGCCVKLLGIYHRDGDRVDARVHPCFVPVDHLLSNVNGVLNAVYLKCDNLGETIQTGAGAGRLPTPVPDACRRLLPWWPTWFPWPAPWIRASARLSPWAGSTRITPQTWCPCPRLLPVTTSASPPRMRVAFWPRLPEFSPKTAFLSRPSSRRT